MLLHTCAAIIGATATDLNDIHKVIVDGMREALTSAGNRGWEAQMMVVVIILMLLYFVYDKWLTNNREQRLATRITHLEEFTQVTLLKVVSDMAAVQSKVMDAIDGLQTVLRQRVCLLDANQQDTFVDRVGDRVSERVADCFRKGDPK